MSDSPPTTPVMQSEESATAIWPIRGESMLPTLLDGQRVLIRLGRRQLERGDLLLFRHVGELAVHRFLGWTASTDGRPCLRTRGDGRPLFDPPFESEMVEGRVIAIESGGCWRDLRGAGAKLYALGLVLHCQFWALAGMLAKKLPGSAVQSWVGRIDQALLGVIHRLLFKRLHAGTPSPPT